MIDRTCKPGRRVTLAGDKLFDAASFVTALRTRKVTPHIAVNGTVSKLGKVRKTLIDQRTTRHEGYATSLRVRKRIEEAFGWAKTIGGIAKLKVRGLARAEAAFTFRMIAYNLVRLPKLLEANA
jgi:IS5 family transposase